jgi:hypothetical protein
MRIREEDRNMVLLATVTAFTAAIAGAIALTEPAPESAPAPATSSAYLADQTPVRVVGPSFTPNVNPRDHQ